MNSQNLFWRDRALRIRSARTFRRLVVGLVIGVPAVLLATFTTLDLVCGKSHGFFARVYQDPSGIKFRYTIFVPKRYGDQPEEFYPLILYLHGYSHRGSDGKRPVEESLGPMIRATGSAF